MRVTSRKKTPWWCRRREANLSLIADHGRGEEKKRSFKSRRRRFVREKTKKAKKKVFST